MMKPVKLPTGEVDAQGPKDLAAAEKAAKAVVLPNTLKSKESRSG
jgi:hypothetical protein